MHRGRTEGTGERNRHRGTEGTGERNRTIICPQIALASYDILRRNTYKT